MNTMITALTLGSLFFIIYHHIGYPLILRKFKQENPKTVTVRGYRNEKRDKFLPTISIIVPAYNEEKWITEKILNIASLDYPSRKLEVVIVCDGCTDETAARAKTAISKPECKHLNISIKERLLNIGKVGIINHSIQQTSSELVALTDVSSIVSIDALIIAAENFKQSNIGVVNSHYQFCSTNNRCENTYWQYQSKIKSSESALGSTLGAHGAFYVIRRSLFNTLPNQTINDDFVLPMNIVAKGYRAIQDNRIVAIELETSTDAMDFERRIRISRGNLQQLIWLKGLLSLRYKGVFFTFASGKALRALMPLLLITCMVGSILLSSQSPAFFFLMACQTFAYAIALYSIQTNANHNNRYLSLITYIVRGHTATLIGSLQLLTSKK